MLFYTPMRAVALSEESTFLSAKVFLPGMQKKHLFLFGKRRKKWKLQKAEEWLQGVSKYGIFVALKNFLKIFRKFKTKCSFV